MRQAASGDFTAGSQEAESNAMRRAAIVVLLALGCASSGSNHDLGIMVFEAVASSYGDFRAATILGSHMLRVQIENRSHQDITVHTIRLEPNDPDLFTDDPAQSVEEIVGAGDKRSFDMYFTISSNPRTRSTTSRMLDSIKIDLSCTASETGNFVAGGTYSVNHIALGQ